MRNFFMLRVKLLHHLLFWCIKWQTLPPCGEMCSLRISDKNIFDHHLLILLIFDLIRWGQNTPFVHIIYFYNFFSDHSDGAGVERRHCQSHDDKTAAVLLENGPHHCGSDEQGQCLFLCERHDLDFL